MNNKIRMIYSIKEIEKLEVDGGGILPYAIKNNKIYFLLGRENIYDKMGGKWNVV